jgi:predicted ester cyclase
MTTDKETAMTKRRSLLALGILSGMAALARLGTAFAAADCVPATSAEAIGSVLLNKYVAAVNAHDTGSFAEFCTENYIQHSGRSPDGLAALIENFRAIYARMPDIQARVEDRIIAGDKVVARMAFSATHTQPLQEIAPTGRRFTLRTMDIWRVENGKFAEHWDVVDYAGLQKQLRGE